MKDIIRHNGLILLPIAALLVAACSGGRELNTTARADAGPTLQILSNRADLISGGDALVEVLLDADADAGSLQVLLNGRDVSPRFARRENGRVMGRIESLVVGDNELVARLGGAESRMTVTNYPNEGPIFSRPEIKRIRCQEGAVDLACNQPAEYSFLYRPTAPLQDGLSGILGEFPVVRLGVELLPYDPANPPDDVAMTTTQNGETVPSIVGQELGRRIEIEYEKSLNTGQFNKETIADILVDLKRRIGGDFSVASVNNRQIVLTNSCCPFGDEVLRRDSLCMMTSNVFGFIVSNHNGYAAIKLPETIARGRLTPVRRLSQITAPT